MAAHRYVEEIGLAAMLSTKRLAGVTPEVNFRECVTCMPLPSANKALKVRGNVTRNLKHGYHPTKRTYVLQKFKKLNIVRALIGIGPVSDWS